MVKKLLRIVSKYLLKKAGFPQELLPALMVADPVSAAIGAGGSILGGVIGGKGQSKAAKAAAAAQDRAAELQRESAREALALSREGFEYGQEQDLYQKALQRQLAQQQAEQMNENIQPFINLGLGSLGGLSRMVNPTMGIDSGLYELAGMQPRQATNIGPTFDPSAAQNGITPINFDEMDDYIQQQLQARRQAQEQVQPQQQVSSSLGLPPEGQEIINKLIQSQALNQAIRGATDPSTLQSLSPGISQDRANRLVSANKRRIRADLAERRRIAGLNR